MWSNRTAGLPMSAWWRSTMPPSSVWASTPSTRDSSPISSTAAIQSRKSLMATLQFPQDFLGGDWQIADARAARLEDGVADGGRHDGRAALAQPMDDA